MRFKHLTFCFLSLFFFLSEWHLTSQNLDLYPKNEFRAVWVATVANIDWPKNPLDPIEKKKKDFISILDTYKELNYNAVIVQIRTAGDAFYRSDFAPLSRFLVGRESELTEPIELYYDLLKWMISEAHNRGLEFHAWFNPFRATFDLKTGSLSRNHDFYKHRKWMVLYGGKYYYNPTLKEVQDHLISIVEEVVRDYDIDAVHFDDYFYPYQIVGKEFDDYDSYRKTGNGISVEDWRRENINNYVRDTYFAIKRIKPWVQFGISPFGVWRNKSVDPRGSDTRAGQTNYDHLFADPLAWMEGNYIDYLVPQLYWNIDHPFSSYSKLLKWWAENSCNVALYIGNASYKINNDAVKKWYNPQEISNQIKLCRSYRNVKGNAFYSAKAFVNKNYNVKSVLANAEYKYPALPFPVPNSEKKITVVPEIIDIKKENNFYEVQFKTENYQLRYGIVYAAKNSAAINANNPSQILQKINLNPDGVSSNITIKFREIDTKKGYAISFIDFYGNETDAIQISL